jgi:hypothetical protein
LQDQPFYPTNINTVSIIYDGSSYIAPANLPEYSAFLLDGEANYWDIAKIANTPLGLTDIVYGGNYYVMTSTNSATPIFRSGNGTAWTTNGYFTPYGSEPYDSTNYDMTALSVSSMALSSVAYALVNNIPTWVAVGKNIVTSYDTYVWNESYVFDDTLTDYNFYTITYIDISGYKGFIAAGISDGQTVMVKSVDGIVWTDVEIIGDKAIYGIDTNGTIIIAVGEDGVIYTSTDSIDWILSTYTATTTLNDISFDNNIFMAEVGKWTPWDPNPNEVKDQEYNNDQLNTLMKKYHENEDSREQFFEQRTKSGPKQVFGANTSQGASASETYGSMFGGQGDLALQRKLEKPTVTIEKVEDQGDSKDDGDSKDESA